MYPLASPFKIRPAMRLPAISLALPRLFPMFEFDIFSVIISNNGWLAILLLKYRCIIAKKI